MNRLIVVLTGTLLGATAVNAAAIPISDLKLKKNDGSTLSVGFAVHSPPAGSCSANSQAVLALRDNGRWRAIRRLGRHSVDVCRNGDQGWTRAPLSVSFGQMHRLKPGKYAVVIRAWQRVNGRISSHSRVKIVRHRGAKTPRPAARRPQLARCPHGVWQYAPANLSGSSGPFTGVVAAGSTVRVAFRCKFGRPGVRYGATVCMSRPSGAVKCRRKSVVGDRFGARSFVRTTRNVEGGYVVTLFQRPGNALGVSMRFQAYREIY